MVLEPIIERRHLTGLEGIQKLYRFTNSYGASVVKFRGSYGFEDGLWELAVVTFAEDNDSGGSEDNFKLCFNTSIADDVIGWLNDKKVEIILQKISELPTPYRIRIRRLIRRLTNKIAKVSNG